MEHDSPRQWCRWESLSLSLSPPTPPPPTHPLPPSRNAAGPEPQQVASTHIQPKPELTKTYFKLLQAIHHSEIISSSLEMNIFPRGMSEKCPLSLNQLLLTRLLYKVELNTAEWVKNYFLILREHYDDVISSNLLHLSEFQLEAYNKALNWAHSRYGRKLTKSSIDTLRSMIMLP